VYAVFGGPLGDYLREECWRGSMHCRAGCWRTLPPSRPKSGGGLRRSSRPEIGPETDVRRRVCEPRRQAGAGEHSPAISIAR
jgi:hypothetical protein